MERIIEEIREDLSRRIAVAADRLADRTLAEDPAYAALLGRAELRERIHDTLRQAVEGLLRSCRGLPVELADARAVGALRAEQGLPLASLLRTHRRGGRLLWQSLTEAVTAHDRAALPRLLPAASVLWDVVDRTADAMTESYRRAEAAHGDRDRERRAALLDVLLDGADGPSAAAEAAAAQLGLPERGRFTVVVLAAEVSAGPSRTPSGDPSRTPPGIPSAAPTAAVPPAPAGGPGPPPPRGCCGASVPTGRSAWWSWATIRWSPYGTCSRRSGCAPGSARSSGRRPNWLARTGWRPWRCAPPPSRRARVSRCWTNGCRRHWSRPRPSSPAGCVRWCWVRCSRCPWRTGGRC